MHILLKYLFNNIKEKKLRSFLVFISLALTAGLFYTSLAITDTVSGINREINSSLVGNADIKVFPKESEAKDQYIDIKNAEALAATEYAVGMLEGRVIYSPSKEKMIYAGVIGTTLEDLELHNPVIFSEKQTGGSFEGKQIIISKITAEKYGLSLGDTMQLEFGNCTEEFSVFGIAELRGLFMSEGATTTLIIPKTALSDLYQVKNQVNSIYIKLKDSKQLSQAIQQLQQQYPDCEVTEAIKSSDLKQSMNEVELPLKLVTVFIILMCVYIVYTSFKIISLERLPHIGTFRSVGATKRMAANTLRIESLIYGIAGGIAGMGIGVTALWFITKIMASDVSGNHNSAPEHSLLYFIITLLFAVVLSYLSAMVPISGIFRIPTKNLILNQTYKESKHHWIVMAAAVFLLVLSILVPRIIPENKMLILIVDNTCVGFIMIAFIILLPVILMLITPILEKLFSVFGKDSLLAAKNVKNNKNILNITGLLVIGISTMIMISSINESMINGVLNLFTRTANYDIQLVYKNADQKFLEELNEQEGIKESTGVLELEKMEVDRSEETIKRVYGIDTNLFLDFWKFDTKDETLMKLNEGRSIIMGSTELKKLGLKVGDEIPLKFESGIHNYKIVGVVTTLWKSGNLGLISYKNMMEDSNNRYFSNIYVKTDQPAEKVQASLQAKYLRDLVYNRTISEAILANTEGVDRVFKILKAYTALTMLIGIIGIANNLIVSFIERKRSFAVYRSVGMSRRQLRKMILFESIACGMSGGGIGVLAAALMLTIMPDVLEQMMGPMKMVYSLPIFLGYFMAAVFIMVIASVLPAFKSSKMSVIEIIKYE